MPFWLGASIVFAYGAVVGSFLNVLIYRLPNEISIVLPPSHCPNCKTRLRAWDLVPMLSFLASGCKCRYCKKPISWRYFIVELLTALLGVALYKHYGGFTFEFGFTAAMSAALIAIFFIDLDCWIIPDELSLFLVVIGVLKNGLGVGLGIMDPIRLHVPFTSLSFPMLASIPSMLACGGVFYLIAVVSEWVFKKEAMGGGDVKLAAGIGANLCFLPAMVSFFVAVFLGAMIGIPLLLMKKKGGKDALPFGPMMVAGVFIVLLAYIQLSHIWQLWQNFITKLVMG